MTYITGRPTASEDPSNSQSMIRDNFDEIKLSNDVNHTELGLANQGKHKFLQMPEQMSAPITAVNEAGFYSRQSTFTGNTELVFRRESNGSQIEFTGLLAATNGWTRLPSGILLKWGTSTANGLTATSFPLGATIPAFTAVYSAQVTTDDASPAPNTMATLSTFTTTAITVYGSQRINTGPTAVTYRYLVIGV